MTDERSGLKKKPLAQTRVVAAVVAMLNIALVIIAILSFWGYISAYQQQLTEENLGNIANLNRSSALNATAFISSWNTKLEDIVQHIGEGEMTRDEALALIERSNSSEDRQFELIGSDYTGYIARRDESGGFSPVSYDASGYSGLQRAFDDTEDAAYADICFAPEFTDSYSALKYFAVYRHVTLKNEERGSSVYTLLLASRSRDVLSTFNSLEGFEGQSSVLIGPRGNYIVSSTDFKSDNFFTYLYVYNDLTLDERLEIERTMSQNGQGELYYKDALGRDCVFRYESMETNGWYCVTCVPISSFRDPALNTNLVIYAIVALLLLLVIDVTWLTSMNSRLRGSVQREKEASGAKTEFLSRMSHDIRTPLNGIIGLTSLALDEESSPRVREYLDNIKVSGQFLTGLVNDILDLSKVESGKVELNTEPYTCRDLCRYVEAVVAPLCRNKNINFIVAPPDNDPPVLLDRLRFNQIVFNLLSNAVKYTPDGGTVELEVSRLDLPEGVVELDCTVRDNGIGMSPEFQKHMFESFTQEHSQTATTGSGLGLAIVSSLVKLMNGEIRVKSTQGKGTAITVHLRTVVCERGEQTDEATVTARLEGRRVLLCEDNRINIMVSQRMLEQWGVRVDSAVNGRIGAELFEASDPGYYDVILMDIMMPEMNGIEATQLIRSMDRPDARTIPIIAMTANAYDSDAKNCINAGMNAHLGKPVDRDVLRNVLNEMIGKREPMFMRDK